jgi:hypothetical protein
MWGLPDSGDQIAVVSTMRDRVFVDVILLFRLLKHDCIVYTVPTR